MRSEFYRADREHARCERCRSPFWREPNARFKTQCASCFKAERDQAAYLRGYQAGREAALREATGAIPADRLRQLLQVAHPDKHNGSRVAVEVTQWLLAQRRVGAEVAR
jgi:hypothetical protein